MTAQDALPGLVRRSEASVERLVEQSWFRNVAHRIIVTEEKIVWFYFPYLWMFFCHLFGESLTLHSVIDGKTIRIFFPMDSFSGQYLATALKKNIGLIAISTKANKCSLDLFLPLQK